MFLCNVAQFTASEARVLRGVCSSAAAGWCFSWATRYCPSATTASCRAGEGGSRVLPALLARQVSTKDQYRFDPLDYRHPLVRCFKAASKAGLLTTPVYKYFELTIPEASRAQVALAFDGGDPAIVEETIGRGRSILVATEGSLVVDRSDDQGALDHDAGLAQLRADRAGDSGRWPVAGRWASTTSRSARRWARRCRRRHGQTASQASGSDEPGGAREEACARARPPRASRWIVCRHHGESGVVPRRAGAAGSQRERGCLPSTSNTAESDLRSRRRNWPPRICPATVLPPHAKRDLDEADSPSIGPPQRAAPLAAVSRLGLLFTETFLAWRFGTHWHR